MYYKIHKDDLFRKIGQPSDKFLQAISQRLLLMANRINNFSRTHASKIPYRNDDLGIDFTNSIRFKSLINEENKTKLAVSIKKQNTEFQKNRINYIDIIKALGNTKTHIQKKETKRSAKNIVESSDILKILNSRRNLRNKSPDETAIDIANTKDSKIRFNTKDEKVFNATPNKFGTKSIKYKNHKLKTSYLNFSSKRFKRKSPK